MVGKLEASGIQINNVRKERAGDMLQAEMRGCLSFGDNLGRHLITFFS